MRARVIPTLLIADSGLVKTVRFKSRTYIGDPINAIRLYNDMEVDEILVLDITASHENRGPDLAFIRDFSSESFMPFGYGGGVSTLEQMGDLFNLGVEKVVLNHALIENISLLGRATARFGSQSVVGAMDMKRDFFGRYHIYDHVRRKILPLLAVDYARRLESEGAGELLVYDVDRDGVMEGYDLSLVRDIASAVSIPVIASGGAGSLDDLASAVAAGASGVAAGSIFVYQSKRRGVLINYPSQDELDKALGKDARLARD